MGGWVSIDGAITHFFATELSSHDTSKFRIPTGDAAGQQLWEALAILVAIDLWSEHWQRERIVLKVKSDNVAALTLLTNMRPPGSTDDDGNRIPNAIMAVVARELALRLVTSRSHSTPSTLQALGT